MQKYFCDAAAMFLCIISIKILQDKSFKSKFEMPFSLFSSHKNKTKDMPAKKELTELGDILRQLDQ